MLKRTKYNAAEANWCIISVTIVVADTSTFSAVHSDVSYAAPDSGYTWSETDTPEITGKIKSNITV